MASFSGLLTPYCSLNSGLSVFIALMKGLLLLVLEPVVLVIAGVAREGRVALTALVKGLLGVVGTFS